MSDRLTLLFASAVFIVLLFAPACGNASYSSAVRSAASTAAWVDARVAGLYTCEAEAELARLEVSGGTVADFDEWERRKWGHVIAASEALDKALAAAAAAEDVGDAAEAAHAILSAAQAVKSLLGALESADVPLPVWLLKEGVAQ